MLCTAANRQTTARLTIACVQLRFQAIKSAEAHATNRERHARWMNKHSRSSSRRRRDRERERELRKGSGWVRSEEKEIIQSIRATAANRCPGYHVATSLHRQSPIQGQRSYYMTQLSHLTVGGRQRQFSAYLNMAKFRLFHSYLEYLPLIHLNEPRLYLVHYVTQ